MPKPDPAQLSRRERQIMDIVYALEQATAAEIHERLPDPPSYSTVRALLAKLETKGHLKHKEQGPRYVYLPTVARKRARESAIQRLVNTFFGGSTTQAVNTMISMSAKDLSRDELERLAKTIEEAKQEEDEQ